MNLLRAWGWAVWLAALVFITPIPHTIALRNTLLFGGVLVLLAGIRRAPRPQPGRVMRTPLLALLALSTWLLLHSLLLAADRAEALGNLRGDWLLPLLLGAVGAWVAVRVPAGRAVKAVLWALGAHMIWLAGWQVWLVLQGLPVGFGAVPFGERDFQSTLHSFLLALLIAQTLAAGSIAGSARIGARGWLALALTFAADALIRARNGTLITLALSAAAAGLLALQSRQRRRVLLVAGAVAALGVTSLSIDPRWSGLRESLDIGWHSSSMYWMNRGGEVPRTSRGAPIEESAYMRAAWARQATDFIARHPLGTGFGRDAFGRGIAEVHGVGGWVSSHSGLLDFTLAVGWPGSLLLLLAAVLTVRAGWRQYVEQGDPAGLMLSFLTGGYLLRILLDGHFSGWRLSLFALLFGVLLGSFRRRAP